MSKYPSNKKERLELAFFLTDKYKEEYMNILPTEYKYRYKEVVKDAI